MDLNKGADNMLKLNEVKTVDVVYSDVINELNLPETLYQLEATEDYTVTMRI